MDGNMLKALPLLDDTIIKIQRICINKHYSMNHLVKIVEDDSMLTANILKSFNSLLSFSREIKNLSHAISLFTMATIRGFTLSNILSINRKTVDFSNKEITAKIFGQLKENALASSFEILQNSGLEKVKQ